jgi:hypothetical protein
MNRTGALTKMVTNCITLLRKGGENLSQMFPFNSISHVYFRYRIRPGSSKRQPNFLHSLIQKTIEYSILGKVFSTTDNVQG